MWVKFHLAGTWVMTDFIPRDFLKVFVTSVVLDAEL